MGNLYYYEEPQPINDSELKSFPNKFIGLYMNTDSVYLNISKNKITKENYFKFKIHMNYLDSIENQLVKVNGRYKFKDEDTFLETRKIGDSIEFSQKEIDTIFFFSDVQKAKRINGNLVLNDKDSIYYAKPVKSEIYIRFVKNRGPQPSNTLTVIAELDDDGNYEISNAWIGPKCPAFPGEELESADSKAYWQSHALAHDTHVVQSRSITKECPYDW